MAYHLEIVTPEKTFFSGEVEHLRAPGSEGDFGVLTGHVSLLSGLSVGQISFRHPDGTTSQVACGGGFAEVQGAQVTVLAETAEYGGEIDVERARSSRGRAMERLAQQEGVEPARAYASLQRALVRLKTSAAS